MTDNKKTINVIENYTGGPLYEILEILKSLDKRLKNIESHLEELDQRSEKIEEFIPEINHKCDELTKKVDQNFQTTKNLYINFTKLKDKVIEKSERDINRDIRMFYINKRPAPFYPINTFFPHLMRYQTN